MSGGCKREAILWPITETYYLRKTFVALLEQPIYWLTVKNIGFKLKNDDVEFSLVDIIENVVKIFTFEN